MTAMARPALLYFLLWLGVTLSSAMDLEKRIIGGQPCGDTERLYHVMVLPKSCIYDECICGGSLIEDQWVLTAAHCVPRGDTVKVLVNVHPGDEKEEMDITPADIHLEDHEHDVALLKLPRIPKKINKIDLPNVHDCMKEKDITLKNMFQVAGHGFTAFDPKNKYINASPTKLLCLNNVPVDDCGLPKTEGPCPHVPYDNTFCAKDPGNKWQTAPGDSGSGALFNGKIYGLVRSVNPTAFDGPFRFVRICRYTDWIVRTLRYFS